MFESPVLNDSVDQERIIRTEGPNERIGSDHRHVRALITRVVSPRWYGIES